MRSRFGRRQTSKSRKISGVLIIGILLFVSAAIFSVKFLSAPAEGTITQGAVTQPTAAEQQASKPHKYHGKTVSFTIPENFRTTSSKAEGPYLDSLGIYSTDHKNIQISVGVRVESLSADSGVMFRRDRKDIYKEQPVDGGVMFIKEDGGMERTVYIQHNDKLLDISATVDGLADLTGPINKIQTSLQWE